MSYDIYLRGQPCPTCERCGAEPDGLNPTYNLAPIFSLAFDTENGIRVLEGMTGKESVPVLRAALDRMNNLAMRERFLALEPANGWGTFDGARSIVEKMAENAIEYPTNRWSI